MAAAITENTKKPRMIQSAIFIVVLQCLYCNAQQQCRSAMLMLRTRSPTRVPSIDGRPRDTFRWYATQHLGEGPAPGVVCSSESLRGSPAHIVCRRSPALYPVDRCRPARSE